MEQNKLPTRIHIGTQKAGSTFLYNLLKSHPDVSLSSQTEMHYYNKYFDRGDDWYDSLFVDAGIRIDTSPKYFMFGDVCAARIKKAVGADARLLLILRNPIDLINSHYQMHAVSGHFKKHPTQYPVPPTDVVDCVKRYPDYLKQAQYYTQLLLWLKHFDQSQIKVVIFEDFIADTAEVMTDILSFWELAPAVLTSSMTSKNKMLKNRFLFHMKSLIVRVPWLKNLFKRSQFFAYVYDRYLTKNSGATITAAKRAELAGLLADEVENLERMLGAKITRWRDFKSTVV